MQGMQLHIKAKNLELTPALKQYAEERMDSLAAHVARWDEGRELQAWMEIARTTNHHKKGEVFAATIDLGLPGKPLRASETEADPRAAIDRVKDTLQREIKKYKETHGG